VRSVLSSTEILGLMTYRPKWMATYKLVSAFIANNLP
jgi:hypothetical protein